MTTTDPDALDLQKMGYVQELLRGLGGFSNFAVSFSVISILTGAIQLYGYGLLHGGPLQMSLGWLLVSLLTSSIALSMAELASAYPTAGALYHWSSLLGGRALGWFTACFNTLGQFSVLAGIDWGLAGFLIAFGGGDATRARTLAVFAGLLVSHAALNHLGIRVVAWLNDFSAWYHMAVVLLLLALLALKGFAQPAGFLLTFRHADGYPPAYSFLVGLLLAQWTLTGYDASAHVSEETHDPRRTAPWGIVLSVVVSALFGFLMLAAITLSIPDLARAAAFGDDSLAMILRERLGAGPGTAMIGLICGAMWLCGLASMTSASRMVYAFARDGGLPGHAHWARVCPRFRTPSRAIWGLAAAALALAAAVAEYSAVLSIAVISLSISAALPIAARALARRRGAGGAVGPWSLGRFSGAVAAVALAWSAVVCVVFILPPNQQAGELMAGVLAVLLLIWFGWSRARFAGPKLLPLAALLLLALSAAPARAGLFGRGKVAARWTKRALPVDGDDAEWEVSDAFEEDGLSVLAKNDADSLYLLITAHTRESRDQLSGESHQDLTLWFVAADGKTRRWGARLPFGRRSPLTNALRDPAGLDPEPELVEYKGTEVSTAPLPGDVVDRAVGVGRRPVWELKIPLKRLEVGPEGTVAVDFLVSAPPGGPRRVVRPAPARAEGPDGGDAGAPPRPGERRAGAADEHPEEYVWNASSYGLSVRLAPDPSAPPR